VKTNTIKLHADGNITCNTHWTIQCSRMLKYSVGAYHTLLYTESSVRMHALKSVHSGRAWIVQKAAMMNLRRVVTGRLAGCKEDLSGHAAVKIPETWNTAGLRWGGVGSVRPNSGARWSRSLLALKCPSLVLRRWMAHCDFGQSESVRVRVTLRLTSERSTLYTCWCSQAPPPGRGVAATLHVHWLGG
jgi:hypothetical protein